MNLKIQHFFDTATSTLSYVVWDADTSDAVIIDPVLDYDPVNMKFSEESIEELLGFVANHNLTVRHVLESHIHADHITGAARLREKLDAKLVVGSLVQEAIRSEAPMRVVPSKRESWFVLSGNFPISLPRLLALSFESRFNY